MHRSLMNPCCLAVLAIGAAAQVPSHVLPPMAFTAEQNASYSILGLRPNHQQIFYTPAMLASVPSGRFTELALRPDRLGSVGPLRATLSIRLSSVSLPTLEEASRSDPRSNVGSDAVWVARDVSVTFPALPPGSSQRPQPLWVGIPLQNPFDYVAGRPLLVEVFFDGPPSIGYLIDALGIPPRPWTANVTTFGSPCASAGTYEHQLTSSRSGQPFFLPLYQDSRLGAVSSGVFTVGFDRTRWNGLPLPISLDALGAPGCEIASSIDIVLPLQSVPSPNGRVFYTTIAPPRDPNLIGATYYTQGFLVDSTFNALGLLATSAWRIDVTSGPDPLLGLVLTFTPGQAFADEARDVLPVLGFS